jgi:hypothetical protein
MNQSCKRITTGLTIAFIAGFSTHLLYNRWHLPADQMALMSFIQSESANIAFQPQNHTVTFVSPSAATSIPGELPLLQAHDLEGLRAMTGKQGRVRGRVFRVGYSGRSNTYFLDFGPSREALSAVIFASAVELFELRKLAPKTLEGKEIEIEGTVKNHPQYGLEIILESPAQVKAVK